MGSKPECAVVGYVESRVAEISARVADLEQTILAKAPFDNWSAGPIPFDDGAERAARESDGEKPCG
jgi:hypothetical protein